MSPASASLTPRSSRRKTGKSSRKGGIILTTTHAFGGIHRALSTTMPPPPSTAIGDIVAMTLRMFGQGMKVACEIAAMAADAGLVRTDEEIISIGGTGAAPIRRWSYSRATFTAFSISK